MGEDPKQEWIRQTQKGRKLREELRAKQADIERVGAEREAAAKAHLEAAEKTAGQLRYLTEMWGAFQGKGPNGERVIDFDAADEAFRQNSGGLSFDEYARLRARRGVANPEAARLKADLRRRELEIEQLRQTNGAAAAADPKGQGQPAAQAPAAAPAEPPAPAPASSGLHANPEEFWDSDVPADHPLRQFTDWAKLVDRAMLQFHDDVLDEYSRDAEEIATELLEKKLAALGAKPAAAVAVPAHTRNKPKTPKNRGQKLVADPDAPPTNVPGIGIPASKLVPRGPVNMDRSHRPARPEDLMTDGGLQARQNWAIERAKLRARGIDPDTMEAASDD